MQLWNDEILECEKKLSMNYYIFHTLSEIFSHDNITNLLTTNRQKMNTHLNHKTVSSSITLLELGSL